MFVLSLIGDGGTFLDVGCREPKFLNNTLLLEENGWTGVSIDINDYSNQWEERNTLFIQADALKFDYKELSWMPTVIDYLSLDIEGEGLRYNALLKIIVDGLSFRVITIEHDAYCGYDLTERRPQRELLNRMGYTLIKPDVKNDGFEFEDWWIKL